MSESDSFIQEVSEEVRRDRLFGYFRRYGWIAVLAVLLIVGGAAALEWRKARAEAEAQALGDAMLEALSSGTAQSRVVALQEVPAEGDAAAIRDLMAAAELAGTDQSAAGALLLAVADNAAVRPIYRDLAVLRLTMLPDYPMFSDERLQRLAPLTVPGAPLRLTALEQTAYIHAERGEAAEAIEILRGISRDAEASTNQRQRALDMIVALGGDVDAA